MSALSKKSKKKQRERERRQARKEEEIAAKKERLRRAEAEAVFGPEPVLYDYGGASRRRRSANAAGLGPSPLSSSSCPSSSSSSRRVVGGVVPNTFDFEHGLRVNQRQQQKQLQQKQKWGADKAEVVSGRGGGSANLIAVRVAGFVRGAAVEPGTFKTAGDRAGASTATVTVDISDDDDDDDEDRCCRRGCGECAGHGDAALAPAEAARSRRAKMKERKLLDAHRSVCSLAVS